MKCLTAKLILLICVLTPLLANCAMFLPPVEIKQLIVTNKSPHDITSIKLKLCDESDDQYVAISKISIAINTHIAIDISESCVDVIAVNAKGDIIGSQKRLRIPPKVSWVIR